MATEVLKKELDLFEKTKYQGTVESHQWIEYRPKSNVVDSNSIEFEIQASADEYIDMKNIFLLMKAKIVKGTDGSNFANTVLDFAPTNYILNTAFEQLAITLGSTLVSQAAQNYNYLSYIEYITSLSNFSNKSQSTSGFSTSFWNEAYNYENPDSSLVNLTKGSAAFEVYGKIHGPIFTTNKLLISGVPIKLEFTKANEKWPTVSTEAVYTAENFPVLRIQDMSIFARKVKIAPSILNAHASALRISNAMYPIKRPIIKVINLPLGQSSFNIDNLFLGQLPSKLILGLVDDRAYKGNDHRNPLRFQNFNLISLQLNVNGEAVPKVPYTPNFTTNLYTRVYHDFLLNLGYNHIDNPSPIDTAAYKNGVCLYAFNLNNDFSFTDKYINLPKSGYINVQIKLNENLVANSAKLIVYAQFDNIIEIDENRNVTTDY